MRKTVTFTAIPELGDVIVVSGVASASEAFQQGVRPGMTLLYVSDPARPEEIWDVNPGSSLTFVRDAVRYRNFPGIRLGLGPVPPRLEDILALRAEREATIHAGVGAEETPTPTTSSSLLSSSSSASASASASASMDDDERDRWLARERAKTQAARGASQRRIAARKAYLSQVEERDDRGFLQIVMLVVLTPILLGFVWAYANGFLEQKPIFFGADF
jgi:hypothetical protein